MTTQLILSGANPARSAAAIAPSTVSISPRPPDIARNVAGTIESTLNVSRCRPASRSVCASGASRLPLVVNAMSSMPGTAASLRTSSGRSRRNKGSPPVRRSLRTPSPAKIEARRSISSKRRRSALLRNWWSRGYWSSGMQYGQRKLQRSRTEMRKSESLRPRRSLGCTSAATGSSLNGIVVPTSNAHGARQR